MWGAIERACANEDFRPHVGPAVQLLPLQARLPRLRPRAGDLGELRTSTRRSTPPSRRSAAGPRSIAPPRWSPTWPTTASSGWCWPGLRAAGGARPAASRRRASAAAGFSSLLVSRAAKAAVERQRPEEHLEALVRTPSSSSFPSGHTLAAFCTAFVLRGLRHGDGGQRRFRRGRGGQPGPPAGASPHRCHRWRRHRLGAGSRPAADRQHRHARERGPAGSARQAPPDGECGPPRSC